MESAQEYAWIMNPTAIVLFAHGSRDPKWREPFDAMLHAAQRIHDGPVMLAFLEAMHPTFDEAVDALVAHDMQRIRLVPLFLAAGSHIREDLPQLVARACARYPDLCIDILPVLGDDRHMQTAIVNYALGKEASAYPRA